MDLATNTSGMCTQPKPSVRQKRGLRSWVQKGKVMVPWTVDQVRETALST